MVPTTWEKITKDKIDLANSAKYSHFPGWVSFWDHSQIVEWRKEEKKQFGQKKEKSLDSFTKKRILLVHSDAFATILVYLEKKFAKY